MRAALPCVATAIGLWIALAGAVQAANLPFKGSYGNKDGCAYAKSGESTGSDDFFLLTNEAVTTASTHCILSNITKRPKGAFGVTATCEEEGNTDDLAPFEIVIEPVGKDRYALKIYDGQTWGPLALCK